MIARLRNANDFRGHVLHRYFQHMHDRTEGAAESHREFARFFHRHYAKLYATHALLANSSSKELFVNIVLLRLLGQEHITVDDTLQIRMDALAETLAPYERGPSRLPYTLDDFDLVRFENVPYKGSVFSLDFVRCGLATQFFSGQYDYESGDVRVMVESGDVVIDGGCCMGDTCIKFSCMAGERGRVVSFDILATHLQMAAHNIALNPLAQGTVTVLAYGLSDRNVKARPLESQNGKIMPGFSISENKGDEVPLMTIDTAVQEERLDRVDFIKMDIEGSELPALRGAHNTIEGYHPKLAICVYHEKKDLFVIPQYLKNRYPFYSFYLGHYSLCDEETVLYAIDHVREKSVGLR